MLSLSPPFCKGGNRLGKVKQLAQGQRAFRAEDPEYNLAGSTMLLSWWLSPSQGLTGRNVTSEVYAGNGQIGMATDRQIVLWFQVVRLRNTQAFPVLINIVC